MQRSFLLVLIVAMAAVGFFAPVVHAYTYCSGWSAANTPVNWVKVAQQQTLSSSQTLPDIAYVVVDDQSTESTSTLYVRVNGYVTQIDDGVYYKTTGHGEGVSQPSLTIKHTLNNSIYYIVSWRKIDRQDDLVTGGHKNIITYHYYNSLTNSRGVVALKMHEEILNFGEYQTFSFDSSFESDNSTYFDPASSAHRIVYQIDLRFYDENHYVWSYGRAEFAPASGVYGYWQCGVGTCEYWQYMFIHDGNVVKRVALDPPPTPENDHWHEDRACGNWYWSDECDTLNYACPAEFRYAPNPNDPYDDGDLSGVGPDAVAYRCRLSDSLYVDRTDWTATSPVSVPGYVYWSWNQTFGIVATNCGTVHLLYPHTEYFTPPGQSTQVWRQGIRDVAVRSNGTFDVLGFLYAPYYGGHGEEILDVVPKQGTDREAFDVLVTHYSDDEDGTIPSITYVQRVRDNNDNGVIADPRYSNNPPNPPDTTEQVPDTIYEYYAYPNLGYGQLGATNWGAGSVYENGAYIPGGLVRGNN